MSVTSLLALQAPDGATVTLERYPILLGRSVPGGAVPDVDVSHLDPNEAVDNRHCELTRDPDGVEVHDLGGISGTWVSGHRLPPGGRALLEVGGTIRVAGVLMTLLESANQLLPPMPSRRSLPAPPPGTWLETRPSQGIPPPPSAAAAPPDEARQPVEHRSGLDFSGAPPLAREALEAGAEVVRIRPGAPLEVLSEGGWAERGQQLSAGAAAEAVAAARRVLELAEDTVSGEGHVGDVALEFVLPPLTERTYLAVRIATRDSARIDPDELDTARRAVSAGSALLLVGPWPEVALAALAERFDDGTADPRVLSFGASWWVPAGWPRLDPLHPEAVGEGLTSGELILDQPPDPVLEALLRVLPRPGGGTVLALRGRSLPGALELIARQLDPTQAPITSAWHRDEVARLFPLALSWRGRRWQLSQVGLDGQGRWVTEDRPARPEPR